MDRARLNMVLKPWDLFSLKISYNEIGIQLGGILTILGDIVYNKIDKSVRVENSEYIGFSKPNLIDHLKSEKIYSELAMILAAVAFGITGYIFGGEFIKVIKKLIYKNFDSVGKVNFVNFTLNKKINSIYCEKCKKNLKNVVYKPCLHIVICNYCEDEL